MTDPTASIEAVTDAVGSAADDDERREHPRQRVLWEGSVCLDGREVDCVVHDISVGGARLAAGAALQPHAEIRLQLDGVGDIPARVAWRHGHVVGLEFLIGSSYVTRMIDTR